ncbi:MAG: ABC transporter permease [Anaerolineae bacterium]|nr:MAG: ABC transporter permease [Anaerolineae bacterium]
MTQLNAPVPAGRPRLGVRLGNVALGWNASSIFAFLYLPVLILILYSFNNTRSVAIFTGFSTEWYAKLITNRELLDAARNSLVVGVIATVGSTVIGTMTALAMDRFRFRGRLALDANLYLPIVIPEIVMGISLLLFFNQAMFPLLREALDINLSTGIWSITVAHIAFDIPFVYVIVRARLADFDRSLEEAAQDLGADGWRTFRRVTLPLLMPGIIGGALMAFTLSLDDYLITVFTKGVQSQTMPLYIYSLVRRGVTPEVNALSTVLLVGSMGLVALSLAAQSGVEVYTRSMGLGARVGLLFAGLSHLVSAIALAHINGWLALYLAFIGLSVWRGRSAFQGWFSEWRATNFAAQAIGLFIGAVVAGAVLISVRIFIIG